MTFRESQKFKPPTGFMRYVPPRVTLLPVLFWKECVVCDREVRFERMWDALTGPWVGAVGQQRYACQRCISLDATPQEAAERISGAVIPQRRSPPSGRSGTEEEAA